MIDGSREERDDQVEEVERVINNSRIYKCHKTTCRYQRKSKIKINLEESIVR